MVLIENYFLNHCCSNFICGDYNCASDKNIDRHPIHACDDVGLTELTSIIENNYLCDVWRKLNLEKKRYTFKRNHSKSRIDFVLVSNNLLSNLSNVKIIHFPFSDHDIVCTKIKMNEIERGPGVWVINENTIKSDIFKKAFNTFWTNNVSKINLYHNMKESWDITKYKLKALCIEISSKLNTSKKKLKIMETKLEYLKSKNDDSHMNDIITLEQNIKDVYEKKTESALFRLKSKWYEGGEKSSKYFFKLEKSKVKKNFGIKSNVKMVHINLISILFSMNKLSLMKNYLKRKNGMKKRGIIF